jgi:hypothetical protein
MNSHAVVSIYGGGQRGWLLFPYGGGIRITDFPLDGRYIATEGQIFLVNIEPAVPRPTCPGENSSR